MLDLVSHDGVRSIRVDGCLRVPSGRIHGMEDAVFRPADIAEDEVRLELLVELLIFVAWRGLLRGLRLTRLGADAAIGRDLVYLLSNFRVIFSSHTEDSLCLDSGRMAIAVDAMG